MLQLEVFLGLLHMSIGEFAKADRWLSEAQAADADCPPLVLANMEALAGRGPEARRDGKLRRMLQRFELHIPTRSRRSPPESFRLARGDPGCTPTSNSGPRTWAFGGC